MVIYNRAEPLPAYSIVEGKSNAPAFDAPGPVSPRYFQPLCASVSRWFASCA